MLSAPSTHYSLLSLDRNGDNGNTSQSAGSFDFLPSVSFDDLHTSIESASTDFKLAQFPSPTGEGGILEAKGLTDKKSTERPIMAQTTGSGRGSILPPPSRPGRSGSVLRRPSTSSRQTSVSSVVSSSSGTLDAPTAPAALRNRRHSQFHPVLKTAAPRPPRKSVGPGVVADSDVAARHAPVRRASVLGDKIAPRDSTRRSIDGGSVTSSDSTRNLPTSRSIKAKSVQPPPRTSQTNFLGSSTLTTEQNRLSTLAPQSPRVTGKTGTPSSGGGKRMSMMPGSHATGLGARTISPTDTRRMKRLSMMPQSQSLNMLANAPPPPPPVSMDVRAESRSPSMIPRKASLTPSSARTTPDINNRKSYSSGLSIGSAASYNTVRTSTGSVQPRFPPSSSATRLPAPKHGNTHNNKQADDNEDVPPVPAIPKAYESPKESHAETYFAEKKKSSLNSLDATSIHSNSTSSISIPMHREPSYVQKKTNVRKSSYAGISAIEGEKRDAHARKQLEPLRLPPLNIGPLNFPSTSKMNGQDPSHRDFSPPPSRRIPKTPTTPLTTSKSSFFSKSRYDETLELPSLRSSTSTHHIRRVTPSPPDGDGISSDSSSSLVEPIHKSSISPFLSSSLPKGGFDIGHLKSPQIGGDCTTVTGTFSEHSGEHKSAGRQELNTFRPIPKSPPPDPTETQGPHSPSSKTSLRRKLSLSWKRSNSKSGYGDTIDKFGAQQSSNADSMPPPRIPASASAVVGGYSGLKQPHPSSIASTNSIGANADMRSRKSSAASLTSHGGPNAPNRIKSDIGHAQKEASDCFTVPSTRIASSVSKKMAKPKSSANGLRTVGSWTADPDKDDMAAEEEMRKLGSRRKETEVAGKALDALKRKATPKERVGSQDAIRIAMLNIYERGEIIDYNDVYFCGTQNARKVVGNLQSDTPNFGYDDDRGDYTIIPGDHLAYRYEIVDILGKGSFGQVVRCIDHKLGVLVAIKIIRNKKRFHQQALVEVNILQKLREWDPKNRHSMVNFTQSFYFRGHLCISTELLDMNLYEFIKAHSFRGFSLRIIRRFTKQILSSLVLLKQRKVIHCDLKPENILLRHPLHSEIKVIDFGSSCFEHEKVYTYIQSRFYRSPEVILGMTYGMPIDMWSVGCILAELYTGVPIFPGENEQEQLACIMEVFGPPEKHLIEKSTRKKLFFDSMGKPRLTVSSKGRRRRPSSKTLQQVLKCDDEAFLDFIARCLRWDPDRRLRPEDAVRHEFITGQKVPVIIPRLPAREASPSKQVTHFLTPRPLPDPPASIGKGVGSSARTGINSPHKPVSGASRRISGATAATAASINRRTSAGGSISSISSLPRAAGRTASGRQDLAAAGASAAMSRRV
ncbi:serine/threonine protein kinase [Metarhizium album ARSEF 1941]|uniref:Serine/threonine protein kinase n=1 Tax=Metarhizium album (strain ARSEF 1941) TaxID=1081103 RepID=A0A0B2WKR9_METAS|nr:serine/threonine protein kinase [Metarhizium album ARSEF 1941]KHN96656.1 serine/threonine protein kinase [Metarhizium album ARSEF 1941]